MITFPLSTLEQASQVFNSTLENRLNLESTKLSNQASLIRHRRRQGYKALLADLRKLNKNGE